MVLFRPHPPSGGLCSVVGSRGCKQAEGTRSGVWGGDALIRIAAFVAHLGDAHVPEELLVLREVGLDGRQVDQHVLELLQEEEATRGRGPA